MADWHTVRGETSARRKRGGEGGGGGGVEIRWESARGYFDGRVQFLEPKSSGVDGVLCLHTASDACALLKRDHSVPARTRDQHVVVKRTMCNSSCTLTRQTEPPHR